MQDRTAVRADLRGPDPSDRAEFFQVARAAFDHRAQFAIRENHVGRNRPLLGQPVPPTAQRIEELPVVIRELFHWIDSGGLWRIQRVRRGGRRLRFFFDFFQLPSLFTY